MTVLSHKRELKPQLGYFEFAVNQKASYILSTNTFPFCGFGNQ